MGLENANESFCLHAYAKTLTELRTLVSGDPKDDLDEFLIKVQTLDDMVTDFSPPVPDWCVLDYGQYYEYVPISMTPDGIKGRGKVTPKTLECRVNVERRPVGEKEEQQEVKKEGCYLC